MDRLRVGFARNLEDAVLVEVALRRHGRAKSIRLVRCLDMRGPNIGIRVDGNRRDAHLAQGPRDPHGDLAAVRDQYLSEQWIAVSQAFPRHRIVRVWPAVPLPATAMVALEMRLSIRLGEAGNHRAGIDLVTLVDQNLCDRSVAIGRNRNLHLHRLQGHHRIPEATASPVFT